MAEKSGCPVGQVKVKGKCVDTSYLKGRPAGTIALSEDESDVLFTNLYFLTRNGKTKLDRYPHDDSIATGLHHGKTELQLLDDIKKKVDKIRP